MKDGRPTYTYNFLGLKRFTIAGRQRVPVGKATVRYEFAYDGGGIGKGGTGTLFVNGRKVAEGRIEHTQGMVFSVDEGTDVGRDGETPVVENYGIPAPFAFTGKIDKVTIDLMKVDKSVDAEENRGRTDLVQKRTMAD
ncbi:MAG: putative Arylsulfatase [Proteobacteria bacterium]|nr:putative Arylsulfatase [Pseudomonadota bacterium]